MRPTGRLVTVRLLLPALLLLAGCSSTTPEEAQREALEDERAAARAEAEAKADAQAEADEGKSMQEMLASQPPQEITHGALSRERSAELEEQLQRILDVVQPEIGELKDGLDAAIDKLGRPEKLATSDPVLRTWRSAQRANYQELVAGFHDEAKKRLTELRDAAVEAAAAQARRLATARGPMDAGPTGDPALDGVLETFNEVVDGVVGLNELFVRRSQDLERRVDLFETFSSFGHPEESAMAGRILLFVGGDETDGVPRALVAFRVDDTRDPAALHLEQALRHRILRGSTVVQDLGWRLAPFAGSLGVVGRPATEVLENMLIGAHIEPVVNRDAPGYDELRDMRIQTDVQTAVFEGDKLLGGVDRRIEFVVTARGSLTWQIAGGKPVFDAGCKEVMAARGGGK